MQGLTILWLLLVKEKSHFVTESLHGPGLAADLLQSCSFPVQKLTQWRWLVWKGTSELCVSWKSPASLSPARSCPGLWKLAGGLSPSVQGLQARSGCLLFLHIPVGPCCHLDSVYSKQIAQIPREGRRLPASLQAQDRKRPDTHCTQLQPRQLLPC